MATDTLDPRLAFADPPAPGLGAPVAKVEEEEEDDADDEYGTDPEEPSRFDDPDQADLDQDLDDEDLEDDDGWADEEEDY